MVYFTWLNSSYLLHRLLFLFEEVFEKLLIYSLVATKADLANYKGDKLSPVEIKKGKSQNQQREDEGMERLSPLTSEEMKIRDLHPWILKKKMII